MCSPKTIPLLFMHDNERWTQRKSIGTAHIQCRRITEKKQEEIIMKKRFVSTFLAIALVVGNISSTAFASQADQTTDNYAKTQMIQDHFNCINNNNWTGWANYYAPSVKDSYMDFVTNDNCQENNIGILTVKTVDILSVDQVSNEYAPYYPELKSFFESNNYECYVVNMDITTEEETEYFSDGIVQRLVILVNENGEWGIGASCEYEPPESRGIGYGFLDGDVNNPPTSVKVDMHIGTNYSSINVLGSPKNVPFDTFVKKTVLGEIGTAGYMPEAVKAVTVSDRMFTWWCVLGHYRDTYGCDIIGNFDVAYDSSINIYSSIYGTTLSNINAAIKKYAISSGGKFFAIGANNYTSYDHEASGVVVQSGANRLASSGKACDDILKYYLNNSSFNNGNVGSIIIGTTT